jgi:hypothetical protein
MRRWADAGKRKGHDREARRKKRLTKAPVQNIVSFNKRPTLGWSLAHDLLRKEVSVTV